MYLLFLIAAVLHLVSSSCPSGFDLIRDGECRGLQANITATFAQGVLNVTDTCSTIQGKPVIIHNDEHQSYWKKLATPSDKGYLIIGLVCNSKTKRWEWSDGSASEFRPADGYDSVLDQYCDQGWSWYIDNFGYWKKGNSKNSFNFQAYCTTQLQQPKGDGCDSFGDDSADGFCYQVIETTQNWQDAQFACQKIASTMASIHNSQENSFIRKLAMSNGATNGVYIGAKGSGKQFEWLDGSDWDYKNFYPGFPIDGRGDCLAMDTFAPTGEWMNMNCDSKLAVACQRKALNRPTCSGGPWKEGDIISSPGYPYDASEPCDYLLSVDTGKDVQVEIQLLEANSCCDFLIIEDRMLGGNIIANLTGELSNKIFTTQSSNFMRVSWEPNGGVNVRGLVMTFRGV